MENITTKKCNTCGEDKSLDMFYCHSRGKYRRASSCKVCVLYNRKQHYVDTKEAIHSRDNGQYISKKIPAQRNKYIESGNAVRCKRWRLNRPHIKNAQAAKRRAFKLQATPGWADDSIIKEIYLLAKIRSIDLKIEYQVDHIVPLLSKLVCGLHCEDNLQVISATENKKKSNKTWPDMPEPT